MIVAPLNTPTEQTRFLLIRHALSDHRGRYFAHACPGLTDAGVAQATLLAERLAGDRTLTSVVILASLAARTIETAEILADALGVAVAERTCDLCEVHPGAMEGLTHDEVMRQYGDYPAVPGRQCFEEWYPGAHEALLRIATRYRGQQILAVTHNGVIDASFGAFGLMPMRRRIQVAAAHTSITEWSSVPPLDGEHEASWRLERHNDAAHL